MCMCEGYAVVHLVEALHNNMEGLGLVLCDRTLAVGLTHCLNRNEYEGYPLGIKVVFV